MGAQFFAVYVAASYVEGNHSANRTLQMIDTVRHDIIGRYPNDFVLATTADDIEAAHKQGKIAALMGIEGGHAIEDSLRLLRDYYELGVRYMTLTHMNTNNWADASGDLDDPSVKRHNGLTDFGKDVVREMNRLGMMVDISHVADKTFWDVLEVSRAPVFASHSSCRSISSFFRNMTDEMIVALAKKGGVIQINFLCAFVSQKFRDNDAADTKALDRRRGSRRDTAGNEPERAGSSRSCPRSFARKWDFPAPPWLRRRRSTSITSARSRGSTPMGSAGLRRCELHARRAGGCLEVSQSDAGAAREGLFGGRHPQDLRRQFAASDARGGGRGRQMRITRPAHSGLRPLTAAWPRPPGPKVDPALQRRRSLPTPSCSQAPLVWTNSRKCLSTSIWPAAGAADRRFSGNKSVCRSSASDLWSRCCISDGKQSVVLGRGKFADEAEPRIERPGATRFAYKGYNLVGDEREAVLLVSPTVIGVGPTPALRSLIDNKGKSNGPPSNLADQLKVMPAESVF